MKGTGAIIYVICDWLMRLALLNVLWIGFSLLGAGILGFFPASVAGVALLNEWLSGRRPAPLSFYWNIYKRTFTAANAIFIPALLIFVVLMLNTYASLHFDGVWFYVFVSSTLFLSGGAAFILLLSLLPLSQGEKAIAAVKRALHLLMYYPGRVVMMVIGMVLLGLCIRLVPGILPLYSINIVLGLVIYLFSFYKNSPKPA
ncbi:YesL family protein [Thalassobacillus sp. B23F22_16]|uniref:YesL family protein n=1 Tax=Thalassobacillus sp. B23F22_16 TaxID=3459513 RepID=UPI00373E7A03